MIQSAWFVFVFILRIVKVFKLLFYGGKGPMISKRLGPTVTVRPCLSASTGASAWGHVAIYPWKHASKPQWWKSPAGSFLSLASKPTPCSLREGTPMFPWLLSLGCLGPLFPHSTGASGHDVPFLVESSPGPYSWPDGHWKDTAPFLYFPLPQ